MGFWELGDAVDVGEGYRELEYGEIVPEGAETNMEKKWDPVDGAVGTIYEKARKGRAHFHFPIRVQGAPIEPVESKGLCGKIDPGEGYRLLEEGDLFPHGYEYLSTYNGEWELGELVGNRYRAKTHGTCRAKMPTHKGLSKEAAHNMLDDWKSEANPDHSVDSGPCYKAIKPTTAAERVDSRIQELAKAIEGLPKDPKTKYHRPMYPAWNDPQVHTDTNGHKYLNVDVYSVLAAFDPGHEVAHAVKKLLAAGTRDKGSKIQDYREAIISIEAAIYRAKIEGGAG